MDKFGERLKEERLRKKLTQEQLAAILEIDRTSISKYETGRQIPELNVLNLISDLFNVSLDYITGRSDERNVVVIKSPPSELLQEAEGLSDESKKELEKYIHLLKMKDQMDKGKEEQSSTLEREA